MRPMNYISCFQSSYIPLFQSLDFIAIKIDELAKTLITLVTLEKCKTT